MYVGRRLGYGLVGAGLLLPVPPDVDPEPVLTPVPLLAPVPVLPPGAGAFGCAGAFGWAGGLTLKGKRPSSLERAAPLRHRPESDGLIVTHNGEDSVVGGKPDVSHPLG